MKKQVKNTIVKTMLAVSLFMLTIYNVQISQTEEGSLLNLSSLSKIAHAQGEEQPPTYASKTETTSSVNMIIQNPNGGLCRMTGVKWTVTCHGTGNLQCAPSDTWINGPYYSGNC